MASGTSTTAAPLRLEDADLGRTHVERQLVCLSLLLHADGASRRQPRATRLPRGRDCLRFQQPRRITYPYANRDYDARDRELSNTMADAWVRFAATGDPNGAGLVGWPVYTPDGHPTMVFGTRPRSGRTRRRRSSTLSMSIRRDAGRRLGRTEQRAQRDDQIALDAAGRGVLRALRRAGVLLAGPAVGLWQSVRVAPFWGGVWI